MAPALRLTPAPMDAIPPVNTLRRRYSPAVIEEAIAVLEENPVLLGEPTDVSERHARSRARTLRDALADEGVAVRTRTWPVFEGKRIMWAWCVYLRSDKDGSQHV